jgi:hypothetical protein
LATIFVLLFTISAWGCSASKTATKANAVSTATSSSQFTKLAEYSSEDMDSSWT